MVAGDDAALAMAVGAHPHARIAFHPTPASDLARAVGLTASGPVAGTEVDLDALRLGDGRVAVNMLVAGTPPDRLGCRHALRARRQRIEHEAGAAIAVVVAVGQFLRGHDIVPGGHPGDGRAEVQVYRVARREWRALRRRLATGIHLPHPAIVTSSVRHYELASARPFPVELDGVGIGRLRSLTIDVVAPAYTLLL